MRDVDLRIGQQRLAWGKGEFLSPNDVVNARDARDPFLGETELRTIPTLLMRADFDVGFGTLQGVLSPVFTPDRVDIYGSNWAVLQPDAPSWVRGLANIARRSMHSTLQEPAQRLFLATRYPRSDLTDMMFGAAFSWTGGGVDSNTYYHYGFDGPFVVIDPELLPGLTSIDYAQAGLVDLQPLLAAIDAGERPFRATYVRRHHVGADLTTTLGPLALRLDAAYQSKRVFFRRDFLGAVSPSLQAVAAIEYQTGDPDKLLLLEGIYLRVLERLPAPLLIYERDTLGIAAALRWPLLPRLNFEIRALFGLKPETAILQPEFSVKLDPFTVSLGGLWLDGAPFSLGEHFHRNKELYAKVKLFF